MIADYDLGEWLAANSDASVIRELKETIRFYDRRIAELELHRDRVAAAVAKLCERSPS